jgi:glycosyltransferase involved in cell wall biosynthesis
VANSRFVAERIRRCWDREAEVIPPPVALDRFPRTADAPGEEWLVLSALVPYKRVDLAIRAAGEAGVRLAVVGRGPEEGALRALAGPGVRFLGWIPDEELPALIAASRGLIFPGVEDFGITPLEVMATGRPVVAYAAGGVLETVIGAAWPGDPGGREEGGTGLLVPEQTAEALAEAVRWLEERPEALDPADARARAEEFGPDRFRERFRAGLARWVGEPSS